MDGGGHQAPAAREQTASGGVSVMECRDGVSPGSLFWAEGLERKPNTGRQQLREWGDEAKAKRGGPRQELVGESCFAPLWGGVERVGRHAIGPSH